MSVLIRKYKALRNVLRLKYKWKHDMKTERGSIKNQNTLFENLSLPNGKILILIPHSDDEWIGCSQIIKRRWNDIVFCNMDMSGDDEEAVHKVRYKELENTATLYNIQLETMKESKEDYLCELVKKINPSLIMVPFFLDWHQEHIVVMNVLENALKRISDKNTVVGMYQVSLPILPEMVTTSFGIDKNELRGKWKYFKSNYKTQRSFPYKRFMLNERINGAISNNYAAEIYCLMGAENWCYMKQKWQLSRDEIEAVKGRLNDISKTRLYLKNVYSRVNSNKI